MSKVKFPPYPRSSEDIYTFAGRPEYLACTIVHRTDMRQLMAFRKLRQAMGGRRFLDALAEGVDILSDATGIVSPAGWLYDFIRKEVEACQDM